MIEVKQIDKGCRRLLDLRRFTKIVKQMPVNVRVHWHVADDTIMTPDEVSNCFIDENNYRMGTVTLNAR